MVVVVLMRKRSNCYTLHMHYCVTNSVILPLSCGSLITIISFHLPTITPLPSLPPQVFLYVTMVDFRAFPYRRIRISDYKTKEDVIEACLASVHIPLFMVSQAVMMMAVMVVVVVVKVAVAVVVIVVVIGEVVVMVVGLVATRYFGIPKGHHAATVYQGCFMVVVTYLLPTTATNLISICMMVMRQIICFLYSMT